MFQEMLNWGATMLQTEVHFLSQVPILIAVAIGVGIAAAFAIYVVWKNR
jgi:hypothetical protein